MRMTNNETSVAASGVTCSAVVRLGNAVTEALREMERCPDDSVPDIWNEALRSWETGLRMNHLLEIEEDQRT